MANSLRDQLLKSGIVKQVREEKRRDEPRAKRRPPKGAKRIPNAAAGSGGEIDLARAYAVRARTEADERRRVDREAAEKARLRKERKRKLAEALAGQEKNKADAERVRHFEFGGKIRRIYVDATQLADLNAGRMGVVQHGGRHVLVDREVIDRIQSFAPEQIALLVDPTAAVEDDGVPDDLMW